MDDPISAPGTSPSLDDRPETTSPSGRKTGTSPSLDDRPETTSPSGRKTGTSPSLDDRLRRFFPGIPRHLGFFLAWAWIIQTVGGALLIGWAFISWYLGGTGLWIFLPLFFGAHMYNGAAALVKNSVATIEGTVLNLKLFLFFWAFFSFSAFTSGDLDLRNATAVFPTVGTGAFVAWVIRGIAIDLENTLSGKAPTAD